MREPGEACDVGHLVQRVRERLGVDGLGLRAEPCQPLLISGLVGDVLDGDALPFEDPAEHLPRPLVERTGHQDVIAGLRERRDRGDDGGLPAGDDDPVDTALQIGQAAAGDRIGGVLVARVGPAAPAGEAVLAIREVVEDIAGGLIDRGDTRVRLGVDYGSGMDLAGLEVERTVLRHATTVVRRGGAARVPG
nr:hypothetical protein [Leifsonia xyli]